MNRSIERRVRLALALVICAAATVSIGPVASGQAQAQAQPATALSLRDAQSQARTVANGLVARGTPGFSVAVAVDGHLVFAEGFGYADLEQRVPALPSTRFRIGSISKPLTAVALMQLVDRRKI